MKNKKLSRFLLLSILFFAVGSFGASAQSHKCGSGKCGASTNMSKVKDETKDKYNKEKSVTQNESFEIESFRRLNREYSQDRYERGTIKTH